jgi:arylsulfatase
MDKKPNLLFIFTDQQTARTMKSYGNPGIDTPNMDRLAAQSYLFENAYVAQPVCTPSRATLMTGLYPHNHNCIGNNVLLSEDIPCLTELGDFSEYRKGYFGKWHLGDEIYAQRGFETWVSCEDNYREYYRDGRDRMRNCTYASFLLEQGFQPDVLEADGFSGFSREYCSRLPEQFGKPAFLASEASRYIREHKDEPFIMYVNFLEPHMPYFGPRDDQYDPSLIPLPDNFYDEPGASNPLKLKLFQQAYRTYGHSGLLLETEQQWRKMISNYWGLVSLVDKYMGNILDELTECGLYDDTIIVFTSDHGDMMGSHQLLAKCVMYQESIQVPLLLKLPGQSGGQRVSWNASQIDLVPTLLDLLGHEAPENLPGQSWVPTLTEGKPLRESNVFVEWSGKECGLEGFLKKGYSLDCWKDTATPEEAEKAIRASVRTIITPDGWKYNESAIGEHELYCLAVDPSERTNVYRDPIHNAKLKQLQSLLSEWRTRTADLSI